VNDDILKQAFAHYKSFSRSRVVRDKKTTKTKGYGFVSFRDVSDYTSALKEMQNKYIGHRPCKLSKSTWGERNIDVDEVKRALISASTGIKES
jgi:RNA recognition motif-containing protein